MATILVVDDRPINREFLATLLGYAGHRVLEAGDGADALAVARTARPDLVISDIVMPVMDGVAFVKALRTDPLTASTPVIFFTATYRLDQGRRLAQGCGVAAVLAKPAEPQAILDAVHEALGAPGDAAPARPTATSAAAPGVDPLAELTTLLANFPVAAPDLAGRCGDCGQWLHRCRHLLGAVAGGEGLSLRLAAMIELGLDLAAQHHPTQLLELFCRAAPGILNADYAAVRIADDGDGPVYRATRHGLDAATEAALAAVDPDDPRFDELLAPGRPLRFGPAGADRPAGLPPGALLLVPLASANRRQGWFLAGRSTAAAFDAHDEQLALTLAAQLAQTHENLLLAEKVQSYSIRLGREKVDAERHRHAQHSADLSRRLVTVQEEERRRLAGVVHDAISPNLAAANMHLGIVAARLPQPLADDIETHLEDIRALLDDTLARMRDLSTELRPAVLDYAGLLPALNDYARQFSRRSGIAVQVLGSAEPRVPPEAEALLFRIAQEALSNCARHAGAQRARIELTRDGRHTLLRIADDGVGFDPAQLGRSEHKPGLGLITMRERAEFGGGEFRLESSPGRGTEITVRI